MSAVAALRNRFGAMQFQEYALAIVVVLIFVVGAILEPDTFPTWDNIRNMLTQASVVGVIAIGMTFVIATGGIDLSVGSVLAAAGVFGGILVDPEGTTWLFILGAIGFATLLGTINATSIGFGRVVPFIATLAMFSIAKGLALLLNDKQPVSLLDLNGGSFGDPAVGSLLWFGTGEILGIPVSVYVFLGVTIAGWVVLNRSRYGRHVVAVGGNREAARIAGVPVRRVIISVYILSGFLVGIAAVLLCARLGSASPVSGNLYELDAIGAVVIGGTSPDGREGHDRRHLPRRSHLRAHLQPHDPAQPLDRGAAGHQGRDRARRGPHPAPGGSPMTVNSFLSGSRSQQKERYLMSLKRLPIAIAMATALAIVVAACGGGDSTTTVTEAPTGDSGGGSGETVRIVASVPPTDHGWLGAISKNAQAAAEQYDDVEFELLEAADADSQAQQIEQVISDAPDALVVLPQDGEALTPVAQEAEEAGIPVINVDRLFTEPDAATATILGDNYQIGVLAADYIAEELSCEGNVVEIQGLAGISVTDERTQGFEDELAKVCPDGGIEIVAQQPGDFNPDTGLKVMENILQSEDQIDAVYTHDDDMAQGVVQAIRNAGREEEMFLTGVGGSQDAMEQIKEGGLYRATFLYNPNMAASAVNMARLIALGEGFPELVPPEVPRQIIVPAATVTQDNVEDYEEYAFN